MKKGFTLIELMAVIIVLGIVAVIAYPMLGDTIENSKKKTFASSLEGIYRTVDIDSINNEYERDSKYTYTNGVLTKIKANGSDITPKVINVKGGIKDGNGTVIIDKDGNIIIAIENDKYCGYTTSTNNSIQVEIGSCTEYAGSDSWTDGSCFGFDSSTGTITSYNESCGVDVVIPRNINGVAVKHIDDLAFVNYTGDAVIGIFDFENEKCYEATDGPCVYMATLAGAKKDGITNYFIVSTGVTFNSSSYRTCIDSNGNETKYYYGNSGFSDANIKNLNSDYLMCNYNVPVSYEVTTSVGNIQKVDFSYSKDLITIGNAAFANNKINSVDFHGLTNLTTIGFSAFYKNNLTSVNLSNLTNLTKIGYSVPSNIDAMIAEFSIAGTFAGNQISSVNLSGLSNLTSLGMGTFLGNQISSVDLSSLTNMTYIDVGVFSGNRITNLNLSGLTNLTTIGGYSFNNNNLNSVDLSGLSKLTTIGEWAFYKDDESNYNLATIYTNGKTFDWGTIINGDSDYNFIIGTVVNSAGEVTVLRNDK